MFGLPSKEDTLNTLRKTRDIAWSGLADNIWKNQKLIDGAAVIKETIGKAAETTDEFVTGVSQGAEAGFFLPMSNLMFGEDETSKARASEIAPKSDTAEIGAAFTNPSAALTKGFKGLGVTGPAITALGIAADIAAPGPAGELSAIDDAAKFAAKVSKGKVVESIVGDFSKLGDNIANAFRPAKGKVEADVVETLPNLKTKVPIAVKEVSGEKAIIPAGEAVTPHKLKSGNIAVQDGETYIINKNQYENVKGNSIVAVSKGEFASELKGLTEFVKKDVTVADRPALEAELARLNEREEMLNDQAFQYVGPESEPMPADLHAGYVETINRRRQVESLLSGGPNATQHGEYVLPGGNKYGEILVTAPPEKPLDDVAKEFFDGAKYDDLTAEEKIAVQKGARPSGYQGSSIHKYTEKDILFWIRHNMRDYQGQKVFFTEEVQSEWMQAVRAAQKRGETLRSHELLDKWIELAAKRELQEAVASEAKYIAWTTGAQQAKRYNLRDKVDAITWNKRGPNKEVLVELKGGGKKSFDIGPDGKVVMWEGNPEATTIGEDLKSVVNSEVAAKINAADNGLLEEEGLEFGGEQLKQLYDERRKVVFERLTGSKVKVIDMKIPVGPGEHIVSYADDLGNYKPLTNDKIEVGRKVNIQSVNDPDPTAEESIITQVMGDGKFKFIVEDLMSWVSPDDPIKKGFASVVVDGERYIYKKSLQEIKDMALEMSEGQQAIELTPEIIALIKGEAPVIKKKTRK